MESLLTALLTGIVAGLVSWGGLKVELRYMRRSITRAHKRLDAIGAPNVTLDDNG